MIINRVINIDMIISYFISNNSVNFTVVWCNGSTKDFGSFSTGRVLLQQLYKCDAYIHSRDENEHIYFFYYIILFFIWVNSGFIFLSR